MNAAGVSNESTKPSKYKSAQGVYVTPMFNQFKPVFSSNEYTYDDSVAAGYDKFVSVSISGSSNIRLGNNSFPAIIVANETVRQEIQNSWYWEYDASAISNTGYRISNGIYFYRGIDGPYDILVAPTGISRWADGSVESPLIAYWISSKISGTVSDAKLTAEIQSFYKKFFSLELSDSQINKLINP